MRPGTRLATRWFGQKYECDSAGEVAALARMKAELDALRSALANSSPYLLGSFSYADILMATMLQGVAPVRNEYIYLGPESRKAWHRSELANDYQDLLHWRDRVRSPPSSPITCNRLVQFVADAGPRPSGSPFLRRSSRALPPMRNR